MGVEIAVVVVVVVEVALVVVVVVVVVGVDMGPAATHDADEAPQCGTHFQHYWGLFSAYVSPC